ncbi:MAG: hypothetical protein OIF47_01165 [Marinibacterium sp.]|nr:hypothetical protein [Marinibacterium sp.]
MTQRFVTHTRPDGAAVPGHSKPMTKAARRAGFAISPEGDRQ